MNRHRAPDLRRLVAAAACAAAAFAAPAAGIERSADLQAQSQAVPAAPAASVAPYSTLRIVRPLSDQTIHDNNGVVPIEVALQPPLRTQVGHRLRVRLDDALMPGSWTSPRFALRGVDRGTHTVQVFVTDREGKPVAAAAPVEFHLWRASRLLPSRKTPPTAP